MVDQHRPNPEVLLKRVQADELKAERGKLKIFLGAAPGVGKTHTMLEDALQKRSQGLDVVVGVVESHGRKEIMAMEKEFEILPRQSVEYRGRQLTEFDLDEALKRNPALILIDEMAHTNIPGLRHTKRWQDIKEILDRGIDVYATLNVQHVESLNDVVSHIIHARVKETVPDSMLEMADTIELVDLPPEDLLKRLQEGKVYYPKQAELAEANFFRKGNLIALRELALRVTAERVGAQVLLYRQNQGIKHIWPTREKIMVCVSYGVRSIRLIRAARRMAVTLQAEWIAVHVDMPRQSENLRNSAIQNLRLAEQLGAETRILTGFDGVKELMIFAREQNVTCIIIGKRIRSRWISWLFSNWADRVLRESHEIDVHIITSDVDDLQKSSFKDKSIATWKIYIAAIGITVITALIDFLLSPFLPHRNFIVLYLLGVIFVGLFDSIGATILAAVLSLVAFAVIDFDFQYLITLFVMLVVTQVITHLTIVTRSQAHAARLAEKRTATLHFLSRQLASSRGVDKLLEIAVRYLADVFDSEVLALLPEGHHLTVRIATDTQTPFSDKDQSVAQWVYDLGQIAGIGTDTLPYSDALYVPLLASQGSIGVLRVKPRQPENLFTPEQMHLLEAAANQIALAIEVDRLQDQIKKTELQSAQDNARTALLQSVSHDLRTPLSAMMGHASTLMEMDSELDSKQIKKLGKDIYVKAEQLNRFINNLLQITYLEAEVVKLQKSPHSIAELIRLVIKNSGKKIGKRAITLQLPDTLPDVPFDQTLIEEVLVNLLDNALKFSPADTPIDISVSLQNDKIIVCIEDRGPGIVADEISQLFEKFYRGRMLASERGLGLGLAICRSIIKAHGGDIWAQSREGGGAVFCFYLPF